MYGYPYRLYGEGCQWSESATSPCGLQLGIQKMRDLEGGEGGGGSVGDGGGGSIPTQLFAIPPHPGHRPPPPPHPRSRPGTHIKVQFVTGNKRHPVRPRPHCILLRPRLSDTRATSSHARSSTYTHSPPVKLCSRYCPPRRSSTHDTHLSQKGKRSRQGKEDDEGGTSSSFWVRTLDMLSFGPAPRGHGQFPRSLCVSGSAQ